LLNVYGHALIDRLYGIQWIAFDSKQNASIAFGKSLVPFIVVYIRGDAIDAALANHLKLPAGIFTIRDFAGFIMEIDIKAGHQRMRI